MQPPPLSAHNIQNESPNNTTNCHRTISSFNVHSNDNSQSFFQRSKTFFTRNFSHMLSRATFRNSTHVNNNPNEAIMKKESLLGQGHRTHSRHLKPPVIDQSKIKQLEELPPWWASANTNVPKVRIKLKNLENNRQHGAWFVLADVLDILDLHIVQRQGYANLTVAVEYITKATLFSIFTLLLMLSITHSTSSKLASEYRYRFLIQEELLQISDKEARALVTPQRVHSFVIENLCPSFVEMLMLDPTWTHRGRNDMMTARRKYRLILGLSPLRFRYEGWRTQSPTRVKGAQGLHQKNVTPEAQKSSRSKGETSELTMSDLNIPVQELQSDAVKDKNHSSERENGFSAAQNQGPEVLSGDDDDDEGNQPMLSDESDLSSDHDEDEDGISESIFVKEELSLPNDIMRDAIAYHDRLASVWNTEKTKKSDLWPTIHELYENYLDTAKSDVIPRNALSQLLDEPDSVYSHYISGTQSRNDSYRSSPKHDPPHWESEDSCAIDGKDATPWLEALCRDNLKRIKGMTRTSGDLLTIDMVVGNFHTDIAIMAIPTFEIRVLTGGSARVTLSVPCFVWDKRIHVLEHIVFAVAILQLFITLSRMIIRWFYQRPCIPCSQRVSRALYKHVKYQLQGRYECIVCDRPFDPAEYRRCPNCGCITGDHPHVCALWFHTFRWVNFMYMILCSLIIMAYAMHTRIIQQADRLDKNSDANNEMDGTKTFQFFFVKELTQLEDIRRSLLAVAVLVASRVLLYYITYAETMARGIRILTLAVRSFTGFFLTASIAFVGFMLALHTMLGPYDESFRTIEAALLSSAEMILYKDYMNNAVHAGQQSRNGVVNFVCFSFQLISYLIVLNVLIALVKQAFWIVNRLKPPSPLTQSLMQLWMFLHGHRVSTSVEIVQEFYAQLEEQNNKQKNREIIRHVRWKMSSLEPNQMGAGNKLRAPVLRSASPVFTVRKEVSPTFVSYTSMRADSKAS